LENVKNKVEKHPRTLNPLEHNVIWEGKERPRNAHDMEERGKVDLRREGYFLEDTI
jgi:hypothetical protein